MPGKYLRAGYRWLAAFNQRPLKRWTLPWLLRAIERKALFSITRLMDIAYYKRSNATSLASVEQMKQWTAQKRAEVLEALQTPTGQAEHCIITLICASRKINNPNHRLPAFLQSIIDTVRDLRRVEIVMRVDDDDDIPYFLTLRQRYGDKIRMKIIVAARVGYLALHRMNSEMAQHAAPGSHIIFSVADDCRLLRKGWDEDFAHAVNRYQDGIVFINTWRDYAIPYEDADVFFSQLWQGGPPTLYWAVGRRVLEITSEIARDHADWTSCGNNWMCDNFFEALQFHLWRATGQRRAVTFPETIAARADTIIPQHKQGALFSHSPAAIDNYTVFLKDETQAVIRKMAEAVAKEMGKLKDSISY